MITEELHILTSPKLCESPLPFLQTSTNTTFTLWICQIFHNPELLFYKLIWLYNFKSQTSRPPISVNLFRQVLCAHSTIFRWTLPIPGILDKAHEPSKHIQTNFKHFQTTMNMLEETSDLLRTFQLQSWTLRQTLTVTGIFEDWMYPN